MYIFNPPDIEKDFRTCLSILKKNFDEEDLYELFYDFDFDEESSYELLITPEKRINLGINQYLDISLTVNELIDFIKEFDTAVIFDNVECWTTKRVLIKVEPENFEAQKLIEFAVREPNTPEEEKILAEYVEIRKNALFKRKSINIYKHDLSDDEKEQVKELVKINEHLRHYLDLLETPTEHLCCQKILIGENSLTCMLTKKFTMFGFKIFSVGNFTEDFPPVYDDDVFVEIRFEKSISKELAYNILEAFLFELSSTLGAIFKVSPRPSFEGYSDVEELPIVSPRIRPLLIGNGMLELLKLYNRGVESIYPEVRLLYLTKVIEFVSQTVVQQQFLESVRTKLLSPNALNPDAKYINDLAGLIEE